MLNTMPPSFAQTSAMQSAHYPLTYLTGMHRSGLSQPGSQPGYQNLSSGMSNNMSALSQNPLQPNQQMLMAKMLAQGGQQ